MILDFKDYIKASYDHLLSSVPGETLSEETKQMYYTPFNEFALEEAKDKINTTLKEAFEQNIIKNEELTAMSQDDTNPSKFYCNFKVHKQTELWINYREY